MPFDPVLADRVRHVLHACCEAQEKRMFGGVCWMVDEKMCVGVVNEDLMVRIDPETTTDVLHQPGARLMDFTGKAMKGFVFVGPEGVQTDATLRFWINLALAYNPLASRSPKRKKN